MRQWLKGINISQTLTITLLLNNMNKEVDHHQLMGYLADAGRLLASGHRPDSVSRKALIIPSLDNKVKLTLESGKTDTFLFGKNLAEKLKTAKQIEKTRSAESHGLWYLWSPKNICIQMIYN